MNWSKGKKSKGRGTSFKGTNNYVLHDKLEVQEQRRDFEQAAGYALHDKGKQTAERVGFISLENLGSKDPYKAWREMAITVEAAPELKRRAGLRATETPAKPVYTYSLNWHPDDKPTDQHMLETARETLKLLGLDKHQAIIVQHKDEPHAHVHVVVNLIDPVNGKMANMFGDERKLDKWANDYEKKAAIIRSHNRAAKHEAKEQGRPPPKPKRQSESGLARKKAEELKSRFRERDRILRTLKDQGYKRRKEQSDALYREFQVEKDRIYREAKIKKEAIWKHKRNRDAWPISKQGIRDWKETREWNRLAEAQRQRHLAFRDFERSRAGRLFNIARFIRPAMEEGKGRLHAAWDLATSAEERRRMFDRSQAKMRDELVRKHGLTRKVLSDKVDKDRDAELAALARAFAIQRDQMKQAHKPEAERERQDLETMEAEREKAWSDWRTEFNVPERESPWKARRSAEQRREDGDYKPRQRSMRR